MAEQALLAGDPAAFEQLVLQLMSAQNAARQSGEQLFTKLKVELRVCRVRVSLQAIKVGSLVQSCSATARAPALSLQDNNPQATVTNLIAVLRSSPQPDSRTFCAVLLRKVRQPGKKHGSVTSHARCFVCSHRIIMLGA
jgi:hypothetical protein